MSDPYTPVLASAAVGGLVACLWRPTVEYFAGADRGPAAALRAEAVAAGMNPAPLARQLFVLRAGAVALLLGLWAGAGMPPLAVVGAAIAYHAGPWWVRVRIAAYRRRVDEQVGAVARSLAGQVRAGLGLGQALVAVGSDAPAPLGDHLRQTADDVRHGSGGPQALAALKARVRVESVAALVVALQVAEERGGRLADVLDRIARAADEHARVGRKRETDTAAGRLMIAVMAVFPLVFLGLVHALDPQMTRAVTADTRGQCVLSAVALVVYASVRWGSRILARVK